MDLAPGWRPDPTGHHVERWWDGEQWTDRVRSGDTETTQSFDTAVALPVPGEDLQVPLWRRRAPRLALAAVAVAVGAWLVTGPLLEAADERPAAARAGTADGDGLAIASFALVDLTTRGQWAVAVEFWPSATDEDRASISGALRSCLGEDVLGADPTLFTFDPPTPDAGAARATVTVELTPRVEQLVEVLRLRFPMVHDGTRWVVAGPVEAAIEDEPLTACTGLPAG